MTVCCCRPLKHTCRVRRKTTMCTICSRHKEHSIVYINKIFKRYILWKLKCAILFIKIVFIQFYVSGCFPSDMFVHCAHAVSTRAWKFCWTPRIDASKFYEPPRPCWNESGFIWRSSHLFSSWNHYSVLWFILIYKSFAQILGQD